MDASRAAILRAAKKQLEAAGYRRLTMEALAAESGVTRQTVHNLFGSKSGVLEGLFDLIALESGMEHMREVMTSPPGEAQIDRFVHTFCNMWKQNRVLIRRVHGIAAIEPELGAVIDARNRRRLMAATRIVQRMGEGAEVTRRAAALAAVTSFEFFDMLAESLGSESEAETTVLRLAQMTVSA